MADEVDVYVAVTRATGSSWRPVRAIPRGDDVYEIVGSGQAPDAERWQFGVAISCDASRTS